MLFTQFHETQGPTPETNRRCDNQDMSFRILAGAFLAVLLAAASFSSSTVSATIQQPDELPAGKGREILENSCTFCHDFEEILKPRGKYGRDEWRTVVRTMIEYGAQVEAKDVDVLVDYLTEHLGKRP